MAWEWDISASHSASSLWPCWMDFLGFILPLEIGLADSHRNGRAHHWNRFLLVGRHIPSSHILGDSAHCNHILYGIPFTHDIPALPPSGPKEPANFSRRVAQDSHFCTVVQCSVPYCIMGSFGGACRSESNPPRPFSGIGVQHKVMQGRASPAAQQADRVPPCQAGSSFSLSVLFLLSLNAVWISGWRLVDYRNRGLNNFGVSFRNNKC